MSCSYVSLFVFPGAKQLSLTNGTWKLPYQSIKLFMPTQSTNTDIIQKENQSDNSDIKSIKIELLFRNKEYGKSLQEDQNSISSFTRKYMRKTSNVYIWGGHESFKSVNWSIKFSHLTSKSQNK